jgi:hypothetical protein
MPPSPKEAETVTARDVFFSEDIRPCHAGGYWWDIEGVTGAAFKGRDGFNESAGGQTATKWGARRKLRKYKRRFLRTALAATRRCPNE